MNFLSAGGLASIYSILVAISVFGFWLILFFRKKLFDPASNRSRLELEYHILAELLTAGVLIAGALGTILSISWGDSILVLGLGMLLYTVVNSPGYYASRGDKPMVTMFLILAILTVIVILVYIVS
jgi:hypothetical protein